MVSSTDAFETLLHNKEERGNMQIANKLLTLAISFIAATSGALAEEKPAAPAPASGFEFGAYFDGYYQVSPQAHAAYNTATPPVAVGGPRVVEGRLFDRTTNQLTVNYVELSARKKVGKVAFRLDAAFGEAVDVIANGGISGIPGSMGNAGSVGGTNPAANEPTRNITQATVSYSPTETLTLTFGKFYTSMGFEVAKAKDNLQYSRSFSFNYAIPLWHEGLSIAYQAIPSKLTTTLFLLNNLTGSLKSSTSQSPAYGLAVNATPVENLALNYVYHGTNEADAGIGHRDIHELNGTYNITPSYAVAADFVMGSQKSVGGADKKWDSMGFYAKAQFVPWYTLSPRYEIFHDTDNYTTGLGNASGVTLTGLTVTNSFDLGDGFEARLEYRADTSDKPASFKDADGNPTDSQTTYTAAFLMSF